MKLKTKYNLGDEVAYTSWNKERIGIIVKVEAGAYIEAGIVINSNKYKIRYGTEANQYDFDIEENKIKGKLKQYIEGQSAEMKAIKTN